MADPEPGDALDDRLGRVPATLDWSIPRLASSASGLRIAGQGPSHRGTARPTRTTANGAVGRPIPFKQGLGLRLRVAERLRVGRAAGVGQAQEFEQAGDVGLAAAPDPANPRSG